ncbi:integrase [Halobacteriales archaeon QS_1_68_20]|nr:MAG: integrase [Halobacteriales archaeon QS_1_68_20]
MVDVNDASGMGKQLQRQWELLEEADIPDADRAAISAFVTHRREIEDTARSTRRTDLSNLRCASERADVPLTEMDLADVRDLFDTLTTSRDQGGYGLDPSGSGMFDYKRALRVFFDWLDGDPEYGDYPFADRITLPDRDVQGAATEDEMLTPEEVERLKDAANHPRDRALIALLADVCPRVTLLLGLRVGDVSLDGDEPWFRPNPNVEDGHKGVDDDPIPILYSRGELRSWVNQHHPDPRDHAPLWPVLKGYDRENPQQCALGDDRLRDLLAECADRADLDKPAEPHHFRRVALTRMSNSDRLTPQEITHIAGWASQQMLEVYDYTTAEERNAAIHETLGFSDGKSGDGTDLDMDPVACPNCRTKVPSAAHFCPQCGAAVDEVVKSEVEDRKRRATEQSITADDPDAAVVYQKLAERLDMDPEFVRQALSDDAGHADSPS